MMHLRSVASSLSDLAIVALAAGTLTTGTLATGCGSGTPPAEPGVVARIDTVRITQANMVAFANKVPATGDPEQRRESLLRGLLARHVLEHEVRSRGLDTLPQVLAQAEAQWQGRMRERYRRDVLWNNLQISNADVEAFFDSLGLRHQRRTFGILTETKSEADSVRAALQAGADFTEAARRHSRHPLSAQQGGLLGYVSHPQARQLQIPDDLFQHLPDGELSPVLPSGERFQIVLFDGQRQAQVDEHRIQIRNILKTNALAQAEARRVDELAERFNWQLQPRGQEILARHGATTIQPWQLPEDEAAEPLFTYDGGVIPVGQYVLAAATAGHPEVDAGTQLARDVVEEIRTATMLFQGAMAEGLGDNDVDRRWRASLTVELAVEALRRETLAAAKPLSPQAVRDFFEQHPEAFRAADEIVLVEAHVDTREEADAVMADVMAGQPLAEVAATRTKREESLWQAPGVLRMGHKERLQMPQLYAAAQQSDVGKLTGPLALDGGFSVFEVIDRQRGEVPEFSRVERRARALAARAHERVVFEAFIDDLLDRYGDRVAIYPEELTRALPDTLLTRLSTAGL